MPPAEKSGGERLFSIYGYDRWYLNVDADEYFVCESSGGEPIAAFASRLRDRGVFRVPAVMLDFYPRSKFSDAVLTEHDPRMPWEVATHFDGDGYRGMIRDNGMTLTGGVRRRFFGLEPELIKYPLVFWNRRCFTRQGRSTGRCPENTTFRR